MSTVNESEVNSVATPDFGKMKKEELIQIATELSTELANKEAEKAKQDERQKDWGHQFDIWLIRASRKERAIEFFLNKSLNLTGSDVDVIEGVPKRVDKYEIQVDYQGREIWLNKANIAACSFPADGN